MSLSLALASDLVHINDTLAAAINHFDQPLALHPANAQPEFVEMVHVRTFRFDENSNDDLDAFLLAIKLDGPCTGMVGDSTVTVIESNGELLMGRLKAAGISFKYESNWVPSTEEWIESFYQPPVRDQDNWH